MSLCGISVPFGTLSPTLGLVTHVLLTRAPLTRIATNPFDLHVLRAPLTFVLSQDQTLQFFIKLSSIALCALLSNYCFSLLFCSTELCFISARSVRIPPRDSQAQEPTYLLYGVRFSFQ